MSPTTLLLSLATCVLGLSCGSGSTVPGTGTTGGGFAGTYPATFNGTFQNTSPNTDSGNTTTSATITVTNVSASEIELVWTVPPNPPSGSAYFQMSGSNGTLTDAGAGASSGGVAVKGSCFEGVVNGNTQTNCCTACSITFSASTLSQQNAGTYTGTTAAGVAYTGTYSGTWTGTRQ